MLIRLFFMCIGLLGLIPIIYVNMTGRAIDSSHYQYAAVGLFIALFGFLFGLFGVILGAAVGLVLFKIKEDVICNFIDIFVKKLPKISISIKK